MRPAALGVIKCRTRSERAVAWEASKAGFAKNFCTLSSASGFPRRARWIFLAAAVRNSPCLSQRLRLSLALAITLIRKGRALERNPQAKSGPSIGGNIKRARHRRRRYSCCPSFASDA